MTLLRSASRAASRVASWTARQLSKPRVLVLVLAFLIIALVVRAKSQADSSSPSAWEFYAKKKKKAKNDKCAKQCNCSGKKGNNKKKCDKACAKCKNGGGGDDGDWPTEQPYWCRVSHYGPDPADNDGYDETASGDKLKNVIGQVVAIQKGIWEAGRHHDKKVLIGGKRYIIRDSCTTCKGNDNRHYDILVNSRARAYQLGMKDKVRCSFVPS